jgi:DnaJ-class molecular chaperone
MSRFKAGESFLVPLQKTTTPPCIRCDGGGFVTVKQNPGGDRKSLCPACHGKRQVTLTCELIHSVTIATTNATPRVAVATPPRKKGE